jgi:bifunctional UDP-N-acetylglucosamine pyrophosphorylase / glucosamine-1-phosphate N-acetyltransferase
VETVTVIILAAGKGTRMNSDLVKVLHPVLGIPMLSYSVDLALNGIHAGQTIVVVGYQADRVQASFQRPGLQFAIQQEQNGTGHAALQTLPLLEPWTETVLILCGDVPLVKHETIQSFMADFTTDRSVLSVLTTVVEKPSGYGRIIRSPEGWLERIVEEKDASEEERQVREINTGLYCVRASYLREGLKEIRQDNAQREYYLTDLVSIARQRGLRCSARIASDPQEVMGINTRIDLALANGVLRQEKLRELMLSGVTILDPRNTYVERSVEIERDTVLYPNCVLEGKTRIGKACVIGPNVNISDSTIGNEVTFRSHCVITESHVEDKASIGPFAHLRPLTRVMTGAKIGNFVEVKKSVIGKGSKANHLTYLGDSFVGENVNVGAGTITCNYDGIDKHQTVIGDRAFIGSNVELVAPVKVGHDASIGAGTTITKNVPDGALAISRVDQKNIGGWSKRIELRRRARRKKKE